jgi:hypothetical protein
LDWPPGIGNRPIVEVVMRVHLKGTLLLGGLMWMVVTLACSRPEPAPTSSATVEPFVPGLGEIMSLQQMRHTKLWLAGQAMNWKLAAYEVDELNEGFDDVVKRHPTHKDSPVAPKDVIPQMIPVPLNDLRTAIDKQDPAGFATAYDELTNACNGCHAATNFEFNRVQRPASNPYPNQVFEPVRR